MRTQQVNLPYGRTHLNLSLPEDRLLAVLTPREAETGPNSDGTAIVRKALNNPVRSASLRELAPGKQTIVVITSDHTRPVPSRVTMPLLLAEIRAGNPTADITILVATGFHRPTTATELEEKFGAAVTEHENIVVHDSTDSGMMTRLGVLPSGGDLILNRLAVEADLLIAEGFIEPHFFAGFSGGRKSVLPGVAARQTVLANHCAEFIAHERARTGILEGNPIHEDMRFAAEKARLAFILNVALDDEKQIIAAFAGHPEEAHARGCECVAARTAVDAAPADIVITTNGGYPLDQNIYQSVKGMTAAEATCKPGGAIILAAECCDGHGGEAFYRTFAEADSVLDIKDSIRVRDRNETEPDQWESQILARILLKHAVIMVTDAPRETVESMHLQYASTIDEALALAEKAVGIPAPTITVIPDGVGVIVRA